MSSTIKNASLAYMEEEKTDNLVVPNGIEYRVDDKGDIILSGRDFLPVKSTVSSIREVVIEEE